jgi:phosphoglycolate phosphatase
LTSLIVFDLDGTLVDSLRDLTDASNELLAAYGARPLDDQTVGGFVGEGAATLVRRLLRARDVAAPPEEALARFLALYDARLVNHTRPYEGIPEALGALRMQATLAVLTNKPVQAAVRILDVLDLRAFFGWVVGGDSPFGRKPDPEGLRAIMAWARREPRHTVLVGDSAIDVRTGRNAGTRVCVARYGFGFSSCPAETLTGEELFVDAPRQLAEVLTTRRS